MLAWPSFSVPVSHMAPLQNELPTPGLNRQICSPLLQTTMVDLTGIIRSQILEIFWEEFSAMVRPRKKTIHLSQHE